MSRDAGDVLVHSGYVAAVDAAGNEWPGGWVAVADGRIAGVGAAGDRPDPRGFARAIDATGCVVIPGLVNAHQHLWYTLFRGLGEGLALEDWLERLAVPIIERISPAELEISARLGCLEMLATGTTAAFYHLISRTTPDTAGAIAGAGRDAGFRLVVGKELRAGPDIGDELAGAEDALAALGGGLVSGGLVIETAGHWISRGTTTEELIHAGWELARRRGLRISNHVSTGTLSPERGYLRWVRETGRTDIAYLHMLGVLDERWLLAHAIWLAERDIELIAASGAYVIDTPTSQAMRGGGVTPAYRLDAAGAHVALGTDGPMVDSSVDMIEQAKALLAEQHQVRLDAAAFDSRRALELATRAAAEAIGLGAEIGSLEPGKRADVAVFDIDRPHVGIVHDPLVSLITAAHGTDARWVLVDGEPRVDDGRLAYDRYPELAAEAAAAARSLAERAGVRRPGVRPV